MLFWDFVNVWDWFFGKHNKMLLCTQEFYWVVLRITMCGRVGSKIELIKKLNCHAVSKETSTNPVGTLELE